MNDTLKQLNERKSIRMFTDREISDDDKNAILLAATNAPTAGNQQLYTIIDVTDQSLKDKLSKTCDNQPFIAKAKLVLIFCADCKKWYDSFNAAGSSPRDPGVGDLLLAVSDTNIAAQNAVIAAHYLGIASCYIGDIMENCEKHRKLLSLPKYVFPAAMLVFGYPNENQLSKEKPRRVSLKHIVHKNAYRTMDDSELREMFKMRCGELSFEEYMTAFCNRKYNSDFSKEMTKSVAEYLKDYQ